MFHMIFNTILTMSIVGGSLSLLIFIMKFVTLKLFSGAWNYYITFAVVIFFLLPVGLFTENISSEFIKNYLPQQSFQLESYHRSVNLDENKGIDAKEPPMSPGENRQDYTQQNIHINIAQLFLPYIPYIWFLGSIIFIGYKAREYLKFKEKLLKTSLIIEDGVIYELFQSLKVNMEIKASITLCSNDRVNTPLLIGLFKPHIIIPEVKMNNLELRNIFYHELIHYKRKDLYLKLVVLLANAVHWFNPLIYKLSEDINEFCELSCDEKVVKNMNKEERHLYGETILNLLDRVVNEQESIYTTLCSTKKSIKRRLSLIMNNKKYSNKIVSISIIVGVLFLFTGTAIADKVSSSLEISEVTLRNQQESDSQVANDFFAELAEKQEAFVEENDIAMLMNPVFSGRITSPFGERVNPVTGEQIFHSGIDLAAPKGNDIVAVQSGKVIATQNDLGGSSSYGNYIILAHDDGTASFYAHCDKLMVKTGDVVKKGEKIAEVGSTGYATGPHCHFEFRVNGEAVDPNPYMVTPIVVEDFDEYKDVALMDDFFKALSEKQNTVIAEKDIAMLISPVSSGRITAPFGERVNPVTGDKIFHSGIDLAAPKGSDVVAAQSGKVIATQEELGGASSYGNYIILAHDDGTASFYAHCDKLMVKTGDMVKKGEKIAEVGSTGYATGPHCHFEFRVNGEAVDPNSFIINSTSI